jgi:hypothetical protein
MFNDMGKLVRRSYSQGLVTFRDLVNSLANSTETMVYCRGVAIISLEPEFALQFLVVYFGGNYQNCANIWQQPLFYFFNNNLSYQVLSEQETSNNGIPQWYKHASSNIPDLGKSISKALFTTLKG